MSGEHIHSNTRGSNTRGEISLGGKRKLMAAACLRLTLAATLLVGLCSSLLLVAEPASACSCAVPESAAAEVEETLARDVAVFAGTVRQVVPPPRRLHMSSADQMTVHVEVTEVWNGSVEERAVVYTAVSSASCGYEDFQEGSAYLITGTPRTGGFTTGLCEMTLTLDQAQEHLAALGAGSAPLPYTGPVAGEPILRGPVVWSIIAVALLIMCSIIFAAARYWNRSR